MSVLVFALATLAAGGLDQSNARITAVANARLRAEASDEVRIVATVPLGTDLTALDHGPGGDWIRVRTTDGTEGWIKADLTIAVPPGERDLAIESIVRWRVEKIGLGFSAGRQLADLAGRRMRGRRVVLCRESPAP